MQAQKAMLWFPTNSATIRYVTVFKNASGDCSWNVEIEHWNELPRRHVMLKDLHNLLEEYDLSNAEALSHTPKPTTGVIHLQVTELECPGIQLKDSYSEVEIRIRLDEPEIRVEAHITAISKDQKRVKCNHKLKVELVGTDIVPVNVPALPATEEENQEHIDFQPQDFEDTPKNDHGGKLLLLDYVKIMHLGVPAGTWNFDDDS